MRKVIVFFAEDEYTKMIGILKELRLTGCADIVLMIQLTVNYLRLTWDN